MSSHSNHRRCLRLAPAAIALSAMLSAAPGCFLVAAGAAGAGSVAYVRGELDAHLGSPLDAVANATDNAIAQLQLAKISETRDAFSAKILARSAEDEKIDVTIVKEADNLTKVSIRIGVFGKEEKSRAILDKIKASL